jgi:hypothetical protein
VNASASAGRLSEDSTRQFVGKCVKRQRCLKFESAGSPTQTEPRRTKITPSERVKLLQNDLFTPGHQVVLVKPTGLQPILLAGDLWTSRSNNEHDRVPRFDASRVDTIGSRTKILETVRGAGAVVWISHEPKDFHPTFNANWRTNSP